MEEAKQLEAIPMENFRVLIYKVSIEDYIKERWNGSELRMNKYDSFFDNLDKESFCKALVAALWQYKNIGGLNSYNRAWAIKMAELGVPKESEYAANVPIKALDLFTSFVRKIYNW